MFVEVSFLISGQPKIWIVMNWVVLGRSFAQRQVVNKETGEYFLNINLLRRGRLSFMRASVFEFTRAFYDLSVSKMPMFMKMKGHYLGRSSWSTVVEVTNSSGDLLLTNTNQLTGVDLVSRKSKPHPEPYKEKYQKYFIGKPLIFDRVSRPSTSGRCKVRVEWTDIDENEHATWYSYVRMVINGASKCAKEGSLGHFRENKLRGLHKLQLHFYGESFEGDELDVYVWEEKENFTMIGDVCKNDNTIFQGIFHFFTER